MKNLGISVVKFLRNESGQDLIEYALVAGLIGVGAVAAMSPLATAISTGFTSVTTKFTTAIGN